MCHYKQLVAMERWIIYINKTLVGDPLRLLFWAEGCHGEVIAREGSTVQ